MSVNEESKGSRRNGPTRPAFGLRGLLIGAVGLFVVGAAPATAQPGGGDAGGLVFGTLGGGFGDGTFIVTGAGAGFRLTRHVGLDLEVMHLSGDSDTWAAPPLWDDVWALSNAAAVGAVPEDYPPLGVRDDYAFLSIEDVGRDVTTFLTRFTVEFPVANGRLFPYLSGGGGVSRVKEGIGFVFDPAVPESPSDWPRAGRLHRARTGPFGRTIYLPEQAEVGLTLALGGGVDLRLWRGLGVGVDLRWLRVFRPFDALDTALLTGRVSYRF